ncbi:MAG: hypothetical protein BMS9Abin32_182 [Gammaproteobacteria bacterium]|nr:MAG: hypothetical protein BMS9Abin32_182 [Gammaproteobacteria bacterium]
MTCNWAAGSRRLPRGFTLVEILVVVVIMGVVSAAVLLSFGIADDQRALQQQARRLVMLIELTRDEATLQGRDFGLEVLRGGYRFVELDPLREQWVEVIGDDLLRQRQLDEGMRFDLLLEDRRVSLRDSAVNIVMDEDDNQRSRDLTDDYEPHVLILSSGDISPFELKILRDTDRSELTIRLAAGGEFEINADDQAPL